MSQNLNHRLLLYVWVVVATAISLVAIFGHGEVRSADLAISESSDSEAKAFLPFIRNAGVSEPPSNGPTLISPENNAVLQTISPTFKFDMGTPSDDVVGSCFAWSFEQDFSSSSRSCSSSKTPGVQEYIIDFNLQPDKVHYWRVGFALDSNFVDMDWSETRGFTTGPSGGIIPPAPTHISPADGSKIAKQDVVLIWDNVPGSITYHARIRNVDENRQIRFRTTSNSVNLSNSSFIVPGGNYEWSVRARNDYAWGEYSTPWSFSVTP